MRSEFDYTKYNVRECEIHNHAFYLGEKHQQSKVDELQKQKSLQELEINQIAHANQQWQLKCVELQKRVDEITSIATELAEYASYAEIVGGVTVNREAVRSFCDMVFDFNRKVDRELEQALKGGSND